MANEFSTTIEDMEKYRKEYNLLTKPDKVLIKVPCSESNGILMPDVYGDILHWAEFRRMDIQHHQLINKFVNREVYQIVNGVERLIHSDTDMEEFDIHLLRMMLIKWSLCDLEKDDSGYLTEDSVNKILRHPAPLIGAFINRYYHTYIVTKEEEKHIERQSVSLFAPKSRGVDNACEAISLFCMLGNMWEKFGLNYHDLKTMPYRDYVMLRIVLGKEIERHRMESQRQKNSNNTRVAGQGGRTRASRGQVIENPA